MLSKEETQHIAKLARLGLSDSEIENTKGSFGDFGLYRKTSGSGYRRNKTVRALNRYFECRSGR